MNKKEFELKVTINENDCWIWNKAKRAGYGVLNVNKKLISAHRYSYTLYKGEITEGLIICHKCDVKECVNPDHLFMGTFQDNALDAVRKGRMKIPIGHRFSNNSVPFNSTLTKEQVLEIKTKIKNKCKLIDISNQLGIKYQTIRDINTNRSYTNYNL